VPFSLLVTAALVGVGLAVWRARPGLFAADHPWRSRAFVAAATGACAVAFPLAQMWCFGKTDYRRPADAIVVFGAKAKANGEPSSALEERVRTACDLYLQGLAPRLVFSGGPGAGSVHETEAMRRLAIELGVRDSDIVLDRQGLDTQATVRNTSELFARMGVRRVLAVSHFYHLPRIKLTYHREGWEVYTVPAKPIWVLRHYPFYMLREVAALWVYYLRPLSISASRI
jgi:vancomycin permeability regulator SanA